MSQVLAFQQLLLNLNHPKRYEDELVYGAPNADVCDWFERYREWPLFQNIVIGPEKSGKTTVLKLAQKRYGVYVLSPSDHLFLPPVGSLPRGDIFLDDAEKAHQEWLFHLINHQHLEGHRLTLLSSKSPQEWVFETKDLESRLKSFYPHTIYPPDDVLFEQLCHKYCLSRCITYDKQAIDYLLLRIERTYEALFNMIKNIDAYLLNKHKPLTLPLLRSFLKEKAIA